MMNGEALYAISKMRDKPKVLKDSHKISKEYEMAFWDGQETPREEILSLRWYKTTWFDRFKYFIRGRPDYRMKSQFYNREFYTTKTIDDIIKKMDSPNLVKETHTNKKYGDVCDRFLARDEEHITALRMML